MKSIRSKTSLQVNRKWRLDLMENFQGRVFLAEGAYGRVYKVNHESSNHNFALKMQDKKKLMKLRKMEEAQRELEIHQKLDHPHIVSFIASFETPTDLITVMEYVKNGCLSDYIQRDRKSKFTNKKNNQSTSNGCAR